MNYKADGTPYRSAFSRSGSKAQRETAAELDSYGETALTNAKAAIARCDPSGTALKFAFITDLHRCGDGISYASEGIVDDRYSIRLLSRLCDEIDISAVFCGGDVANARSENISYHEQNMRDVVNDLDSYIPYTNIFSAVGNHDKKYSASNPLRTNAWLKQLWTPVQMDGNGVKLTYIDDTNFCVDFTKHKVRIIFCNQYDAVDSNSSWTASSIHCTGNWTHGFNIADKEDWLVGVVYHGADASNYGGLFPELETNLDAYVDGGGKGSIGGIAGHLHTAKEEFIGQSLNRVHVSRAYAQTADLDSTAEYCFSVAVIDSATGLWHNVRVGKSATEVPFCAYFGAKANGGLLQNGTYTTLATCCIYNGNHVRFDRRRNAHTIGYNLSNPKNNKASGADSTSTDTENVLFSAQTGDVIKTEIIFSADNAATVSSRSLVVFSPQIANMVSGTVKAGVTYTKEITLEADTDVTAIGMSYYGQTADSIGIMDFELNIYKNGVKLVRSEVS